MDPHSRLQKAKGFTAGLQPNPCVISDGKPCSACKEDAEIDRRISELEGTIACLKTRRKVVRNNINEIHDPLNRKLPPEIVSYIFSLSLTPPDPQGVFPNWKEWAAPLLLGAICTKWRRLAWSTPRLWTNVIVSVSSLTAAKRLEGSFPQLVTEWLDRSGVLPLTIRFSADRDDKASHAISCLAFQIINILNQHSKRWQNLDLSFQPIDFTQKFHGSSGLKNIRHFSFTGDTGDVPPFGSQPLFRTEISPIYLTLSTFHLPFNGFNIAWENITNITLESIPSNLCIEAVENAQHLEVLRLWSIYALMDDDEDMYYVQHPSLRSVEFDGDVDVPLVAEIMDCMELPSFEEWSYLPDYGAPIPLDSILSLLERSSCCLKVLKLSSLQPNYVDDFRTLLEGIPSLEHLSLWWLLLGEQPMLNDIFDRLCDTSTCPSGMSEMESIPQLLPHLQTLEIDTSNVPFLWDRVPAIFRSSNRGSLSMKFSFSHIDVEDAVALQLLQLVDEGRKLRISTEKDDQEVDFIQELREGIAKR